MRNSAVHQTNFQSLVMPILLLHNPSGAALLILNHWVSRDVNTENFQVLLHEIKLNKTLKILKIKDFDIFRPK